MKSLITLTFLLCFNAFSFSQDNCADFAEVEMIDTRKVILTYNVTSTLSQDVCNQLIALKTLRIKLDDDNYDYTIFNCNATTNRVIYIPTLENSKPLNQVYQTLNTVFPNGEFATYNKTPSFRLFAGNLLDCFMNPAPAIPTLSQWGFLILSIIVLIFGIGALRSSVFMPNKKA